MIKQKPYRRFLALMLCLVMAMGLLPVTASATGSEVNPNTLQHGDIVYFGSYPQDSLGKVLEVSQPEGTEGVDWIIAENARDGNSDYYKIQPIAWKVVSSASGNELFIVSAKSIDYQAFHAAGGATRWIDSDARSWLNNITGTTYLDRGFLGRAFSSDQQRAIVSKVIDNYEPPDYTTGGTQTTDKLFSLSEPEMELFSALERKSFFNTDYTYGRADNTEPTTKGEWIFTRSQGAASESSILTVIAYSGGYLDQNGTKNWRIGIAPALYLDLTKVTIVSDGGNDYIQVSPTVVWPTAASLTYGQTLSESELTGGSDSSLCTFSWTDSNTTPAVPGGEYSVTVTPVDTLNYDWTGVALTQNVSVTVAKATPSSLTWPTAAGLTYGQTLSDSMLAGGADSSLCTFSWTDSNITPAVPGGEYSVTLNPVDISNYDWAGVDLTQNVSVAVSKSTALSATQTPSMNVKEGVARIYSFDLNNISLNKSDTGAKTYTAAEAADTSNILSNVSVAGNILSYDIANTAALGNTATITITITTENYNNVTTDLTVTVMEKGTQSIGFEHPTVTKTYGDAKFSSTAVLIGDGGSGAITYGSDNTNVATVDSTTGEVIIVGAGSANITATKPADDDWFSATASYSLTVNKRPVTVRADNKSMIRGGALPALTYTVDGELAGDTALIGIPTVSSAADGQTAGSFDIAVDMTGVTGYTANYQAASPAFVNGTLTINNPSGGGTPEQPKADVGGVKNDIAVDKTKGSAAVEIKSEQAKGGTTVTLPEISGVTNYQVSLPASALNGTQSGEITIKTPTATMTAPADMLTGTVGEKARLSIGTVQPSELPEAARAAVGDRPVVSFSLSVDGQSVSWNNPDAPVTVSIHYTPTAAELENPGGIVVWYIDGSGNMTRVPGARYDAASGTVIFQTTHFSYYAVGYLRFDDVLPAAWYYDAVGFIAEKGITSGTTATTFSPDAALTRGQFITLLLRAYDIEADADGADNFSDAGDTYYTGYLAAAKRLGISSGVGDNKFAPEQAITRQEMFTLLYNALKALDKLPTADSGKTLADFSDSGKVASWATEAMSALVKSGTVSGDAGLLSPTSGSTRAQMARVLYKLLSK